MVQFKYVLYLNLVNCADYSFISEFLRVVCILLYFLYYICIQHFVVYFTIIALI